MRKFVYIVAAVALLVSCGKTGAEVEGAFTEYQKKALAAFDGVWLDHTYSNLSEAESAYLLPDPDRLEFGAQYPAEKQFYKDDYIKGQEPAFLACGEVVYVDCSYGDPVSVPCYYYVSPEADYLALYRKDTEAPYKVAPIEFKDARRFLWLLSSKGYAHDFRKK